MARPDTQDPTRSASVVPGTQENFRQYLVLGIQSDRRSWHQQASFPEMVGFFGHSAGYQRREIAALSLCESNPEPVFTAWGGGFLLATGSLFVLSSTTLVLVFKRSKGITQQQFSEPTEVRLFGEDLLNDSGKEAFVHKAIKHALQREITSLEASVQAAKDVRGHDQPENAEGNLEALHKELRSHRDLLGLLKRKAQRTALTRLAVAGSTDMNMGDDEAKELRKELRKELKMLLEDSERTCAGLQADLSKVVGKVEMQVAGRAAGWNHSRMRLLVQPGALALLLSLGYLVLKHVVQAIKSLDAL